MAESTLLKDLKVTFEKSPFPTLDIERRYDTIFVQGVNIKNGLVPFNTADILNFFKEYGPSFVEWLNGEQFNVVFEDQFTAKRALEGLGEPLSTLVDAGLIAEDLSHWRRCLANMVKSTKRDKWGNVGDNASLIMR